MVANGVAATTTAATIAASAFIGSATVYSMAVMFSLSSSKSVKEFNNQGSWATVATTAGGAILGGASGYIGSKGSKNSSTFSKSKTVGKPFNPKGSKVQIGVNPKTLKPSKDLSTLDPQRLKRAEIFGQGQALSVYRNGVVEDGHHRLANALANNRAVDIIIFR